MVNQISRKISFYRAFFRKDETEVNMNNIFSHINGLPNTIEGRYLPIGNGNSRCLNLEDINIPLKGIYGTKRESGLPLMDIGGDRSPLDIPAGGGLYEPMHFVIFPENVIGCEFNNHGPRIESLKTYLPKKAPDIVDNVEIFPLMNNDVANEISKMGKIKLFHLAVHKNMSDHFEILDDNLFDSLNAAVKENEYSDIMEIILRPKRYSTKRLNLRFLRRLPAFLTASGDDVEVAKINAENLDNDNTYQDFDLLKCFVSTRKNINLIDEAHKVVNAQSAFDEIINAYHELKPEIDNVVKEG